MSSTTSSAPILHRLHREWCHLSNSRPHVARARAWSLPVDRFDSLDELLRHAGFGTLRRGGHDDDDVLARLVGLAHDDELAGRVVLQRILPGVVSIARRRAGSPVTRADTIDELVAAAWTVIRTYPVDRRPGYVAANLLRQVEYEVFRRYRRRRATFVPQPTDSFDHLAGATPPGTAVEEVRDLLELAAGSGFEPAEVELVRRLARGDSTVAIAADLGVTDRTIRNRRAALISRLATLTTAA